MVNCPICSWSPDNTDYPFLYETRFWRGVLAPNQSLAGRCVIHLKRHAGKLSELTFDEIADLLELIKKHERALKEAFDVTMFNWSCYMNHAYREDPANPHVHWWAVPRYNHFVRIGDWEFQDPHFGNPYPHERWQEVPIETRSEIVRRINAAIK
jgi:diadenosine tetraphosphate (Ap4A) HIT family hydrolase